MQNKMREVYHCPAAKYVPSLPETLRRARIIIEQKVATINEAAQYCLPDLPLESAVARMNEYLRGKHEPRASVFCALDKWVNARWGNPRYKHRLTHAAAT